MCEMRDSYRGKFNENATKKNDDSDFENECDDEFGMCEKNGR